MKKIILLASVIIVGIFLYGLTTQNDQIDASPELITVPPLVTDEEEVTIWMVTDIHYLSPLYFDDGEAFGKMQATSAGKDLANMPAIMEALVWQVAKEQPDLLIVSGDLTFNGEYQSMVELTYYFKQIEAIGTQVAVMPGNHDIHSGWARKFEGDQMTVVDQVTPADFQDLFADYGYDLAVFKDPNSLSYIFEPKAGYPILMVDTNASSEEKSSKAPVAEGKIRPQTYEWLDRYFQMVEGEKEEIYLVGHHPLLNHSGNEGSRLVMEEADQAIDYFMNHHIKTAFAGHIHAQNISQLLTTNQPFYEIVTGALSIFPNAIGQIRLSNEELAYDRLTLDVEGWANETAQIQDELLNYSETSYQIFKEDGEHLALQQMFEEQWYDESYAEAVMDYVGQMNVRYFSGEDYVEDDAEIAAYIQHDGYRVIQENSNNFLKRYSQQLLKDTNLNDLSIVIPH